MFLRKYAAAATIDGIPLITKGAVDFKANPTLAAGDVTISKDGGATANLASLPAVTPAAGTSVRVALSDTETTCARAVIRFIDQTTPKEWEDQEIIVETFGHASAQFALDLSDAVAAGLTGITGIKSKTDGLPASPAAVGSAMTLEAAYDAAKTAATQTSVDGIKTQTDKLGFTGTDVKATLDGEKVTVTSNEDKDEYALSAAAIAAISDGLVVPPPEGVAQETTLAALIATLDAADIVTVSNPISATGDTLTLARGSSYAATHGFPRPLWNYTGSGVISLTGAAVTLRLPGVAAITMTVATIEGGYSLTSALTAAQTAAITGDEYSIWATWTDGAIRLIKGAIAWE